LQSWDIILIKSRERKEALVKAALNQTFIAEAPFVLVVCANMPRTAKIYGDRGANLYALQDTAAYIQTLLLLLSARGLGACWIGAFRDDLVAEALEIPMNQGIRPVAIIPIGKPAEQPRPPKRIPLNRILYDEIYGKEKRD